METWLGRHTTKRVKMLPSFDADVAFPIIVYKILIDFDINDRV